MPGSRCASPSKSFRRTAPSLKGARDGILDAELGFQRRLRMRRVGVAQSPAVRQNADLRNVRGADGLFIAQLQRHDDGRMRAAAAGKLLEPDGRRLDLPGRAPVLEHLFDVVGAGAVEHVEKALMVLEHVVGRLKSAFGNERREQAVAAAMTDMERLGHGAEIGLEAAGERRGDGQRLRRPADDRASSYDRLRPQHRTCRASMSDANPCRSGEN